MTVCRHAITPLDHLSVAVFSAMSSTMTAQLVEVCQYFSTTHDL